MGHDPTLEESRKASAAEESRDLPVSVPRPSGELEIEPPWLALRELADVLARLPDHPARRIHELLPYSWSPPAPSDVPVASHAA